MGTPGDKDWIGKRDRMVSLRLTEEEFERIEGLIQKIQARQRYVKKADILRELLGVVDTGLISVEERQAIARESNGSQG